MSRNIKCKDCKGIGYFVIGENECKDCKGTGKTKSVSLNQLSEKDLSKFMKDGAKCSTCNGTGKIPLTKPCKTCNGIGRIYNCIVCGKKTEVNKNDLCDTCAKKTLVYSLGVACNLGEVEIGKTYIGVVDDIANFG
ncbi:MAG: phosphoesterase, partial [Methanosarcinales archaeon]